MQCRNCGTEIADKAIICYRCGVATTDPVRKAVPVAPRRSPLFSFVLIALLLVIALYLGQASRVAANTDYYKLVAGICAGAAAAILVLGVLRRR